MNYLLQMVLLVSLAITFTWNLFLGAGLRNGRFWLVDSNSMLPMSIAISAATAFCLTTTTFLGISNKARLAFFSTVLMLTLTLGHMFFFIHVGSTELFYEELFFFKFGEWAIIFALLAFSTSLLMSFSGFDRVRRAGLIDYVMLTIVFIASAVLHWFSVLVPDGPGKAGWNLIMRMHNVLPTGMDDRHWDVIRRFHTLFELAFILSRVGYAFCAFSICTFVVRQMANRNLDTPSPKR